MGVRRWSWFVFILRRHDMDRAMIADFHHRRCPQENLPTIQPQVKTAGPHLVLLLCQLVYSGFSGASCVWHTWILFSLGTDILQWRRPSLQSFSALVLGRIGVCQIKLRGVRRWISGRIEMHHSLCSIATRRKCFHISVYRREFMIYWEVHSWMD